MPQRVRLLLVLATDTVVLANTLRPSLPILRILLQMSERDCIAVMFCGSHKTLGFGIPLIKVRMKPGLKNCRLSAD